MQSCDLRAKVSSLRSQVWFVKVLLLIFLIPLPMAQKSWSCSQDLLSRPWPWRKYLGLEFSRPRHKDLDKDYSEKFSDWSQSQLNVLIIIFSENLLVVSFCCVFNRKWQHWQTLCLLAVVLLHVDNLPGTSITSTQSCTATDGIQKDAKFVLCILATSNAVECIFSHGGLFMLLHQALLCPKFCHIQCLQNAINICFEMN